MVVFDTISLKIHHGGYFTGVPNMEWKGGVVDVLDGMDVDLMSYWELVGIIGDLGLPSSSLMYYQVPGLDFRSGLRLITDDNGVMSMLEYYKSTDMVPLYVERVDPLQVVGSDGNAIVGDRLLIENNNGDQEEMEVGDGDVTQADDTGGGSGKDVQEGAKCCHGCVHFVSSTYAGCRLVRPDQLYSVSQGFRFLSCYRRQTYNMERAEALVREMEEEGIDAPIDTYHTMMDGYTMIGNEDKCLLVFDRFKTGKVSKALEVSDMMKCAGIKHNLKIYSMLINGFIKLKDWGNAFLVFEDVLGDGLKPDVVLYNNIIRAFCGMGNMERAVSTIDEMQRHRHRPTTRTYIPIIHGFARTGEMKRALEILDMMRRSGCIPTVHTFNALILVGLVEKRQVKYAKDFKGVRDCNNQVVQSLPFCVRAYGFVSSMPSQHTSSYVHEHSFSSSEVADKEN
ncbi:hypothetical protein RJ639_024260 [Escallonia herrerae]|uniref:PB1-like domain-containing protein n=1 Tax=Escallonia herrerae TaxID=1293975 RepID=A0AA88V2M3_9ASTE|nr:hypothetical protein RJ639_024260 [Escallonia herrerae]